MLLKPRYPHLNGQHPLAKGLVAGYPVSEGGGLSLYDKTGKQPAAIFSGAGATWTSGDTGSIVHTDGTDYLSVTGFSALGNVKTSTWGFGGRFSWDAATGTQCGMSIQDSGLSTGITTRSGGSIRVDINGGGVIADSGLTPVAGRMYDCWAESDGTTVSLYIDGVLKATGASSGLSSYVPTIAYIGSYSNVFDKRAGNSDAIAFYTRCLTPSGVVRRYVDPFSIYRPNRWAKKVKSAAASGAAVGTAAGVGAATGVGASAAKSPGSAAGTGTAAGVGASAAAAVGSASGTGTATGVGASAAGAGAASGTGTATGVGASAAAAVGAASGTGTASGVSPAVSSTAYASARANAVPAIPEDGAVDPQTLRTRLLMISRTVNLLLRGKMNVTTTLTLTASATSTTLTDERIGPASYIALSPLTENATILDLAPYISSRSSGSAVITHGSTTAVDCTYSVLILG